MAKGDSLYIGKEICPGYRLVRLLGKGGYGSVWEVQTDDKRSVALKFLRFSDTDSAAKEIRAIQYVKQLSHPNVIPIEKVWCYKAYLIVTMPMGDGSLLDLFETCIEEYDAAMSTDDVLPLLIQAAAGIDFLNARQHVFDGVRTGIQHCDIKPSNMLLFGGEVKLCDFGLSSLTTSTMKQHGQAGSLDYAAPEVFKGRLSDHTDQFSLGITYYFLRTGQLPFTNTPAKFERTYSRPDPDLSLLPVPERMVVAKSLSIAPHDRWSSCREFMSQLTKIANYVP